MRLSCQIGQRGSSLTLFCRPALSHRLLPWVRLDGEQADVGGTEAKVATSVCSICVCICLYACVCTAFPVSSGVVSVNFAKLKTITQNI